MIELTRTYTYLLLTLVMFFWGLNVVAVKFLVSNFPPIAMQGLRTLVAGIVTITVLYFLKDLRKLTKKEWQYTILAALFGHTIHHTFLALGLQETSASNASLILGLIPLVTVIFSMIFLKDRLSRLRFTGVLLGFFGVSIVVLFGNGDGYSGISMGDAFIFLSMVSQAFSFILIRRLTTTLSSRQLTATMLLIGSFFILGLSFIFEPNAMTQMTTRGTLLLWSVFLISAILATSLGHILYNAAIQHIGAGETAIFNNLVPFFSLIGAFIFLGEPITLVQIFGFFFIVTGVILGTGYLEAKILMRKNQRIKEKSESISQ